MINKVLIVGLGSIGKRHLRLARELLPNADIRVLRHQHTYDIPENSNGCFFNLEDAINFKPQIAVIANPAPFHIKIAEALAFDGTHLLIEKPLSSSLDNVLKLLETCQKRKVTLLTGYNLRFLPSLQKFRELLSEGALGRVLSVRCEIGQYLPSWRPDHDYRNGVSAKRELGGGALLELSHELDYLRWIFGEVEWVKATLSKQSNLDIDVEDTAHITLGFIPKTDTHQLIGVVNLDFIRHDATRICIAIGEEGSLRWNGLTGKVDIYEAEAKEWQQLFTYKHQHDESYKAEWTNFLECINHNKSPLVTGEDGLKVLEIIDASQKSSSTNKKVYLIPFNNIEEISA
jgi:predicted dehydrogenase